MFKPQKGKAYENLPAFAEKSFDSQQWIVSTKFDGNQIFIVKKSGRVSMYTSDWKEFYIKLVADEVHNIHGDFVLIGEFMHGCSGKLGDRTKSAILTTYRTNFSKQIANPSSLEAKTNIRIFDILYLTPKGEPVTSVSYKDRLSQATLAVLDAKLLNVIPHAVMPGKAAKVFAKELVKDGWEGAMCLCPRSYYNIGKRVNNSVKLKYRKTADLLCIGFVPGEGKYEGMIGALILKDSKNRIVNVGSGLEDYQRSNKYKVDYLGSVIEIEYEQIMDTYIQPTFIRVRDDKTSEEID